MVCTCDRGGVEFPLMQEANLVRQIYCGKTSRQIKGREIQMKYLHCEYPLDSTAIKIITGNQTKVYKFSRANVCNFL